jgi:glucoamylase
MTRRDGTGRGGVTRRQLLAGGAVLAGLGALGAVRAARPDEPATIALYSETVAFDGPDSRVLVAPGASSLLVAGTRVLDGAVDQAQLLEEEQTWLDAGAPWTRTAEPRPGTATVPGSATPQRDDVVEQALLDVRSLLLPSGASVAGWSSNWRYTWPRDGSHVAAALTATGHHPEARRILAFLQDVQSPDGWFHARYLPDGSGPPDDRERQLDGTGWVLWACGRLATEASDPMAEARVASLVPLLHRSLDLVLGLTSGRDGLPPVSPDYWEVRETRLTLGTAAPLLAGLHGAAAAFRVLGDRDRLDRAQRGADRLAAAIHREFGPDGYPRHRGGGPRCTAVAFLLPPYVPDAHPDVVAAARLAETELRRPAGGLAPGAGWKSDGISWTPETAVFAMTAAATGRRDDAEGYLGWLADHRTAAGSFPEKVLHDESPAAVAPLAWTAANVLLARAALATA